MWTHHPEWAENHPDWKGDGDFDDHHEWHDRDWWHDHHPDWVDQHHPDWYKHPYEHPIAAEEHKHAVEEQQSTITTTTIIKSNSDDRAGHLFTRVRRDYEPHLTGQAIATSPLLIHRLSTGTWARVGVMPAGSGKNLGARPSDVLHSCYKYNYISPSIGWGYTLLHIRSRVGGE